MSLVAEQFHTWLDPATAIFERLSELVTDRPAEIYLPSISFSTFKSTIPQRAAVLLRLFPDDNATRVLHTDVDRNVDELAEIARMKLEAMYQARIDEDAVPADKEAWTELVGPMHTAETLANRLRVAAPSLRHLVESDKVLELTTSDGHRLYPAFLLDASNRLPQHLPEVLANLRRWTNDPWMHAIWLNHRAEEWDHQTAADLLHYDWATEVALQSAGDGRHPLGARALNEERMRIARRILRRIVELVADLPVEVFEDTLYIAIETKEPLGVFAVRAGTALGTMRAGTFEISINVERVAQSVASTIRSNAEGRSTP